MCLVWGLEECVCVYVCIYIFILTHIYVCAGIKYHWKNKETGVWLPAGWGEPGGWGTGVVKETLFHTISQLTF